MSNPALTTEETLKISKAPSARLADARPFVGRGWLAIRRVATIAVSMAQRYRIKPTRQRQQDERISIYNYFFSVSGRHSRLRLASFCF